MGKKIWRNVTDVKNNCTFGVIIKGVMKKKTKPYTEIDSKISKVSEPLFISEGYSTGLYSTMVAVLGGQKNIAMPLSSEIDLINLSRKGLKKGALNSVADYLNISLEKLSGLLDISLRTLQRKSNSDSLGLSVSEQTIEVAEVICKGIEVFGTKEQFNIWLNTPLIAINGCTPLSLLDTTFGTKIIMRLLGRLEHGVYS